MNTWIQYILMYSTGWYLIYGIVMRREKMGNRIAHKGLSSFSPIDVNGGERIPHFLTNPKIPKVGYNPIASPQILS